MFATWRKRGASAREDAEALMKAAAGGHEGVVRTLAGVCDVNTQDAHGATALMKAAAGGYHDIAQHLAVECGADVNALDEGGATALMKAAASGHVDIVQLLAGLCDANVNVAAENGATALMEAAAGGHDDVVRYLSGQCAADVAAVDSGGETALMKAASRGYGWVVRLLAGSHRAEVDVADNDGVTALMKAAIGDYDWVVRVLVEECGADANVKDAHGATALIKAAARGHGSTAWILARVCNVNTKDGHGATALMKAAAGGHEQVVQILVGVCDVNVTDGAGATALMLAAEAGHAQVVRILAGIYDVRAKAGGGASALSKAAARGYAQYLAGPRFAGVNGVDANGVTALMKAAGRGQDCTVWVLAVECGADVNAVDMDGTTALMKAVSGGHDRAAWILAGVCDVNARDRGDLTALMMAAAAGHEDIVRYLAGTCGADVNATSADGATALMKAAVGGHIATVRCLITECGADVDATDEDGDTALIMAAENRDFELVRCLALECSADVDAIDGNGDTALLTAAARGDIDIVRCLAGECVADVNATSPTGTTALMKAAANGHIDTLRYLAVECGASGNAADLYGFTALWSAVEIGDIRVVRSLAGECSADVNATNKRGTTALMKAAEKGYAEIVCYLTEKCGACVDALNGNGDTALMMAAAGGHLDVVKYLAEERNAEVNTASEDGYTAIRLAADRGYQEIQRVLTPFLSIVHAKAASVDAPTASWYISPAEIALVTFVREGNIGGEYRAKWLDAADAAVKLFLPDTSSHAAFEDEVRLWHQLRHPNVIKMYGACDVPPLSLQFFVCEYASNGSLLEYVKSKMPSAEQKVWSFLLQAALGLEYLHERGIVHGDLRCSNILIGSDGLSKLANFSRSGSMQRNAGSPRAGSVRWQSPEVLNGKNWCFASDVYSLGLCILEAATSKAPWADGVGDDSVRYLKMHWAPESNVPSRYAPKCPAETAHSLVWRMCCQDTDKRASLSSIVQELEHLSKIFCSQPEFEPGSIVDSYKADATWLEVQMHMETCENELYRHAFNELKKIRQRLDGTAPPVAILNRFHPLIRDFHKLIAMSSEQTRVLQLSATRATSFSIVAIRRRLEALWAALGESADVARERHARWEQKRSEQVEIFVSEASKTYLLLEELKSQEERLVFLTSLKEEIEHPAKYTPVQLEVLMKAYEDIASKLEKDDLLELRPEWFIPWYELSVDKYASLGHGGYGSVCRAKWLDSDVVVKSLIGSGVDVDMSCSSSFCLSIQPGTSAANAKKRVEAMAMFRREVDIWFGSSHPHVIRLFGACHVGRPFFVCEYATNGTLVSYLRKHPDELWTKLHEAALGVQYLHARSVVHGDLKGNNIVIGSDRKAKVTNFGLSSIIGGDGNLEISAASHWVAPECLTNHQDSRPTFASDIYSLGMCIVEALRIVEAGTDRVKICLPWGNLDNSVVRFHVKHRKLPTKPGTCEDEQWKLVQRMCAFEPEKRIKISTVVDELARLAGASLDGHSRATAGATISMQSVPDIITATRNILKRLLNGNDNASSQSRALYSLYESLWDSFNHVHLQIDDHLDPAARTSFCFLVEEASTSTKKLARSARSLLSLAEVALRCYALRRSLDKFADAYSFRRCNSSDVGEQSKSSGEQCGLLPETAKCLRSI